jgi:hypothetical protein
MPLVLKKFSFEQLQLLSRRLSNSFASSTASSNQCRPLSTGQNAGAAAAVESLREKLLAGTALQNPF